MSVPEKDFDVDEMMDVDIKSINNLNETFLKMKDISGKSDRMKRMPAVITRKVRNTRMMRMIAGALAVFMFTSTLFSSLIHDTFATPDYGTVVSFERVSPVYTETVDNNTSQNKLGLPETLRAVIKLEMPATTKETVPQESDVGVTMSENTDETKMAPEIQPLKQAFTQTAPIPHEDGDYDYYWYGYVAPRKETALRKSGQLVIYTIHYADGNKAYRVYGTWNGQNEGFYACDENGQIFGIVKDVPITWSCKTYNEKNVGTYTFTANVDSYEYNGELPTAEITVRAKGEAVDSHDNHAESDEEAQCTCGTTTDKHDKSCLLYTPECTCGQADIGHIKGCPLWNPKCSCPEGTLGHTSTSCPYYVPLSDCACHIDSGRPGWEHKKGCKYYTEPVCTCEGGIHKRNNKDCLKYVSISTFSIGGGGARDIAGDNRMTTNIPTSGNIDYTDEFLTEMVPGAWKDYVNTIWMNKAFNKFAWTPVEDTNPHVAGWAWNGAAAGGDAGNTTTDANSVPAAVGGVWTVYSGEQLRYAFTNFNTGDTIRLGANINLNGSNDDWQVINCESKNITIDGNDKTIYNFGCFSLSYSNFLRNASNINVSNISFVSAKLISSVAQVSIFGQHNNVMNRLFTDVTISDSLFCSTNDGTVSPMGRITEGNLRAGTGSDIVTLTRCFSERNYLYGKSHVNGLATGGSYGIVRYCGTVDNLICGTGGHSAGFLGCSTFYMDIQNCFSSNEMYGTGIVSGFFGLGTGTIKGCFSTGKLEGYQEMAGFSCQTNNVSATSSTIIQRCYSTVLVGLRSECREIGGFHARTNPTGGQTFERVMKDCYAAGETGNTTTDLDNPVDIGGFYGTKYDMDTTDNCYYDKQTTAMREWTAGNAQTVDGITGVLTSTTDKAGTGLASGTYGNASDLGFRGFSDNTKWTYMVEHYPQLEVFTDATDVDWGTIERANAVKAWSLASTSTVFLDTWDKGYDWDATGVRTKAETSYNRNVGTTAHKGNQYTYDTVREIVSDFDATNIAANSTKWVQLIPGGAPAKIIDGTADTIVTDTIKIENGKGMVKNPGMDWYKTSETVDGQTGYRPLRLIAYMELDAGADQNIAAGGLYDHRKDVSLTMMDSITDNLVVGLKPNELPDIGNWPTGSDKTPHNNRVWSTAKTDPYPNTTDFYAAPTAETDFSASRDAWIYTEIWRAEKDTSGNYVLDGNGNYKPQYSVKVTGPGTGSNTTMDEQKWNGDYPLYADTSVGHKYIITYYWMLSDGRYRTDYKVITITPGHYDLTVNVFNLAGSTSNNTALYTGAAPDAGMNPNYSLSASTASSAIALNNPYTTNVSGGWKKKSANTKVAKMTVTMTAVDKTTVMGTATITGDIKEGSTITIPITYLYITTMNDPAQGPREITLSQEVNITYTVKSDGSGGYYLQFNKLANAPDNEVPSAKMYGDSTGIQATDAYINDLNYNVKIDLYIAEAGQLTIEKNLSSPAEEDEQFIFQVDYRGNDETAGIIGKTMFALITIPAGETKGTAVFVDMPAGWYTVTELASNWRFELSTDQLPEDNPDAVINAEKSAVTIRVDGINETYLFRNTRLDEPWANGKASVTNNMPTLVSSGGSADK